VFAKLLAFLEKPEDPCILGCTARTWGDSDMSSYMVYSVQQVDYNRENPEDTCIFCTAVTLMCFQSYYFLFCIIGGGL
jgi:hypothetical protein